MYSKLTPVDNASNRSQMICILSVPSNMNCHDLLTFIAACQENIHHIRIIRDASSLNQYMTLISFRSQVNLYILDSMYDHIKYFVIIL